MSEQVNRVQENFLAIHERRLLNWICPRLPAWVTSDKLTALGFIGAVIVASGYALSSVSTGFLWLSIGGFFINWFGDSLDGSLARFRKLERPRYGYMLDHSIDSFANTGVAIGLGLSPYIRMEFALIALVGYLLLSVHSFLAAKVMSEFRLSYLGGGPTELRLLLIAITFMMMGIGPGVKGHLPLGHVPMTLFDMIFLGMGALMILIFVVQTTRATSQLRLIDIPGKAAGDAPKGSAAKDA